MIQLMTFPEFERKFSLDVSKITKKQMENAVQLYLSIDKGKDPINGQVLTRVVKNDKLEEEIEQLRKGYAALGDHIIVYERLITKEVVSNITWTYYKVVIFNTLNIDKIKLLLKMNKLKAFS